MSQTYRASFQIPEELGKELSDLLVKQSIYEKLVHNLIVSGEPWNEVEAKLVEIIKRIDKIKYIITTEYVPDEYQSEQFMWDYEGFHIAGTEVKLYEN